MSKDELLHDIETTAYNARAHEKHGAEVRREAATLEDQIRENLAGNIPSQLVVVAGRSVVIFDKIRWLSLQDEYRDIEERADRKDTAMDACVGLRACA